MDPKRILASKLPIILISTGAFGLVGLAVWNVLRPSIPRPIIGDQLESGKRVEPKSRWHSVGGAFESVQLKLASLREAEADRERLQLENMNLRLRLENANLNCDSRATEHFTQNSELEMSKETGSRVGLALTSIEYKVPTQMLPNQLYTMAISFLNGKEDEKAAVILSTLTGLSKNPFFKTAKNYLLTGMAWFRLENYTLADAYFDDVLKLPSDQTNGSFQAQARLWRALISKRTNKEIKAQYWLKDLLEHHPRSLEAKWVNGGEPQESIKENEKNRP